MAATGTDSEGATPSRKPMVTIKAASITFCDGLERVCKDDTTIVRGRTSPLAIWHKTCLEKSARARYSGRDT